MMLRPSHVWSALAVVLVLVSSGSALAETWAEKLGYPAGKRVLILHADDAGMCYEANEAVKQQLSAGEIQSASIMAPCPWFNEMAAWYKENPQYDLGVHVTLTSEWKHYRWAPLTPRAEVPGMVDKDGYLWADVIPVALNAKPEEIETEIRAQIERHLKAGVQPSHMDTHMGTVYARPDFTAAYMKLAEEYRIPAMVIEYSPRIAEKFRKRGIPQTEVLISLINNYKLPKLDDFEAVPSGDSYDEVIENFFELVKSLEPGITEIVFHPSTESEGLKHITNSWQQRVWESQMFGDPRVKEFFEEQDVVFTNWKEIMQRWEERYGDTLPKKAE